MDCHYLKLVGLFFILHDLKVLAIQSWLFSLGYSVLAIYLYPLISYQVVLKLKRISVLPNQITVIWI